MKDFSERQGSSKVMGPPIGKARHRAASSTQLAGQRRHWIRGEPRAPAAPASGRCSADSAGRDSACASGGLVAKVLHLCDSRQAETMGDGRTREP